MRLLLAVLLLAATQALAQSYPSRPVRILVPLSPGDETNGERAILPS